MYSLLSERLGGAKDTLWAGRVAAATVRHTLNNALFARAVIYASYKISAHKRHLPSWTCKVLNMVLFYLNTWCNAVPPTDAARRAAGAGVGSGALNESSRQFQLTFNSRCTCCHLHNIYTDTGYN